MHGLRNPCTQISTCVTLLNPAIRAATMKPHRSGATLRVIMHRRSFSWVLSLLLLLTQHGAVLHELSHLSHGTSTHGAILDQNDPLADSGSCPTCQAFSQVANPATASTLVVAFCAAALISSPEPSYAIVGAENPTPRSRGPPQA